MNQSLASDAPDPATLSLREQPKLGDPQTIRELVESTGFFSAAEADVAAELVEERLTKGPASGYEFLFAERGTTVVGYACFGAISCTVGSYDLFWIAVAGSEQRRGLGKWLLQECEHRIRLAAGRKIYIETSNRPQYRPTRAFYERGGYHVAAVLPEFYGPDDDKVIFCKSLGDTWSEGVDGGP